jgi:hypothetical protein
MSKITSGIKINLLDRSGEIFETLKIGPAEADMLAKAAGAIAQASGAKQVTNKHWEQAFNDVMRQAVANHPSSQDDPAAAPTMEDIQIIRVYDEVDVPCGIGFLNDKLVQFFDHRAGVEVEELTLDESVEWFDRMMFAETRLALDCTIDTEGMLRWIKLIHAGSSEIKKADIAA